jgi:uncharacterized 2Fe-2S/4Fe-4S cluster protein (DUF4445 family)
MFRVDVQPDGKALSASEEQTLLDILGEGGIALTSPCGGEGTCGKCRVRARGALSDPSIAERTILGDLLGEGYRLSCQTVVAGDALVEVPDATRVPNVRVLIGGVGRDVPFFPNVRQRTFLWERLDLHATGSRFDIVARLLDVRADLRADLPLLRELALALRENTTFCGTVLGDRLIEVNVGDTPRPILGAALDIGTTTVVVQVVHLGTGETVATASALNEQTQFGGDVIARINHASTPEGLEELRQTAAATVRGCLHSALERTAYSTADIYEMTVVGNTTMLHLFTGTPPHSLGQLPYSPVFGRGMDVPAGELSMPLHPRGGVHLLPSIAGYVGADTVGAMLATSFDEDDGRIRLLADIGTNCELVLRKGGEILVCSTPAGPAFEGARMDFGMLAGPGAIERVAMDDDCRVRVVGRERPQGICGSGIVDVGAELLRLGVFDETGRIQDADELPASVPPNVRGRILPLQKGNAFEVARNRLGEPILFTQHDVRELQLAKAAVRSGIETLLDCADVQPDALDEVLIAGGFGNYLNKENAQRLGLLPRIPLERIRYVGNAALVGARLALISLDMRTRAERVARNVRHIQIATTPDFRMRFTEAMLFGDEAF